MKPKWDTELLSDVRDGSVEECRAGAGPCQEVSKQDATAYAGDFLLHTLRLNFVPEVLTGHSTGNNRPLQKLLPLRRQDVHLEESRETVRASIKQ